MGYRLPVTGDSPNRPDSGTAGRIRRINASVKPFASHFCPLTERHRPRTDDTCQMAIYTLSPQYLPLTDPSDRLERTRHTVQLLCAHLSLFANCRMQLLRAARDSDIDEEGMKHKVAFGQFITREQDSEALEAVFRRLERRRIPAGRLHFTNPDAINAKDKAEEALGAFRDLSVIFECLELACDSEAHPFYSRCFRMLIERWRHIMKWMAYIVTNAPAIANGDHAVLFGMQVLMRTLFLPTTKKTHIYKDELMAMPITVDIICLNLCRPSSTPEHSHPKDGDPCILVSLLEMFLNTGNAPQYFLSRMKSVGSRTRRTVLEFLVLRPQSLLSSYSLRGALITMQSLAKIFGKINVDAVVAMYEVCTPVYYWTFP